MFKRSANLYVVIRAGSFSRLSVDGHSLREDYEIYEWHPENLDGLPSR